MKKFRIKYNTTNGDIYFDDVVAPNMIDAIMFFYMELHKSERVFIEKVKEIKNESVPL